MYMMYSLQQLILSELWAFQLGLFVENIIFLLGSIASSMIWNETAVYVAIKQTNFTRSPMFFWGWSHLHKQWIVGHFFVYRVAWVQDYDYALQLWCGHPKPYLYMSGIRHSQCGFALYQFKPEPQSIH